MRYTATLVIDREGDYELDLGKVGQIASVRVNGTDCGLRMCAPYRFNIGNALTKKCNQLEITVCNTMVYDRRDHLSPAHVLPSSGLLGPVRLLKLDEN